MVWLKVLLRVSVKELEISGVGFKAAMKGADTLDLALSYFTTFFTAKIPAGIKITLARLYRPQGRRCR